MTPQIINDTNTQQKLTINAENTTADAIDGVLTLEEIEKSKYIPAEFFTAAVQVPNDFVDMPDGSHQPIYDENNPAYKDFDMVRITNHEPGSGAATVVIHYVNEFHIKRWPDRWRAYKSGKAAKIDGTPINQLTSIPHNAITALQAAGVFTIEQLARHENISSLIMSGSVFQNAARKYLSNKEDSKAEKLESELAELKAQMAELLAASSGKRTKAKEE